MQRRTGELLRVLYSCALIVCILILMLPVGVLTASPRGGLNPVEERDERVEEHASASAKLVEAFETPGAGRRLQVATRGRLLPYVRPSVHIPRHLEARVRHDTKRLPLRC
jgi:hypothetical protein